MADKYIPITILELVISFGLKRKFQRTFKSYMNVIPLPDCFVPCLRMFRTIVKYKVNFLVHCFGASITIRPKDTVVCFFGGSWNISVTTRLLEYV